MRARIFISTGTGLVHARSNSPHCSTSSTSMILFFHYSSFRPESRFPSIRPVFIHNPLCDAHHLWFSRSALLDTPYRVGCIYAEVLVEKWCTLESVDHHAGPGRVEILGWTIKQAKSAMDTNGLLIRRWTIGGTNARARRVRLERLSVFTDSA